MAESNDHINYELKMRKKEREAERKREEEERRRSQEEARAREEEEERSKEREQIRKAVERREKERKEQQEKRKNKTPEKHKIKVRVEKAGRAKHPPNVKSISDAPRKKPSLPPEEMTSNPDKKAKMATADVVVKVLVPYFKQGMIASKGVFKYVAREMTHVLMKKSGSESYGKYVDKFFKTHGIILSEDDAKKKIKDFASAIHRSR